MNNLIKNGNILLAVCMSVFLLNACAAVNANPGAIVVDSDNQGEAAVTTTNSLSLDQLKKAAEAGDADAQYALGYDYYYGKNMPQDLSSAVVWIKKAAAQGQPQATQALKLIEKAQQTNKFPKTSAVVTKAAVTKSVTTIAANTNNDVITPVNKVAVNTTKPAIKSSTVITNKIEPATIASTKAVIKTANVKKANIRSIKSTALAAGSQKKLLSAPKNYYTIQLLGAYERKDAIEFIRTHKITPKATYYSTSLKGKPWYVVVYGLYKSKQNAEADIQQLPADVQNMHPWVKSIASVQASIGKTESGV